MLSSLSAVLSLRVGSRYRSGDGIAESERSVAVVLFSGDSIGCGSSGCLGGTSRLPALVFANASRFAAASASVTVTEYVGLSLLPRVASPPPGA